MKTQDLTAQFDYLDLISRLITNWPKIISLLVDLGLLPAAKAAEMKPLRIGDGKILDLIDQLITYVPQIIDLLVKLGILKPKDKAALEFGDGQLLKKALELFLKLLPLILLFLGEEASNIQPI